MVDFTVRQWDISAKILTLKQDIGILLNKVSETQSDQQQAIESEDYEKADSLDMKIKQTKKLVEAKEYQIRQLDENNQTQEVMKADKLQELSELMHKSISKVDNIRERQTSEMNAYKSAEDIAIEEKKKRMHYEQIRIQEERKDLDEKKLVVDQLLGEIDKKVYNDTKSQHQEKAKLDEMIEDINRDIEELMRVLDRKKKEKEMLNLEKQVHEHKIDEARMKYGDQIQEHQGTKDVLVSKISLNDSENTTWLQDKLELEEYEAHFTQQIANFKSEFKSLDEMEQYLRFNSIEID